MKTNYKEKFAALLAEKYSIATKLGAFRFMVVDAQQMAISSRGYDANEFENHSKRILQLIGDWEIEELPWEDRALVESAIKETVNALLQVLKDQISYVEAE